MLAISDKIKQLIELAADAKNNLIISNPSKIAEKLAQLDADGVSALHVITDFDMTLTRYWTNGVRSRSSHGVLEHASNVDDKYKTALTDLYKKYYPIEISHTIPFEEKVEAMKTWWTTAHSIIVGMGLTRQDIKDMVQSSPVAFRPKLKEFVDLCHARNIPVLIFSAGLADVLQEIMNSAQLMRDNMDIVSNKMRFKDDVAIAFEDPLIHTFNKNEATVSGTDHHTKIGDRHNVILMGDSLGDLRMADKVHTHVKLTIGFLNHDQDLFLDQYAKAFDIVVLNDSSLEYVIQLITNLS
ncbi:hypothetical protein O5D80_003995 [Batrachochytrium dendrobatidis]|nr:hypothetical protein O5D80_003995 [Batrachochytrium dendrobatidis]